MSNSKINPRTILITGLVASGKTTLGELLYQKLRNQGCENIKLLDGETVRNELKNRGISLEHSPKDRISAVKEYAKIILEHNQKGIACILCTIAASKEAREYLRNKINHYMEVYLDCPVDKCANRDYKGHYEKAFEGQYESFIGVTDPYEHSDNPDLILKTGIMGIEECSEILYKRVFDFLKNGN